MNTKHNTEEFLKLQTNLIEFAAELLEESSIFLDSNRIGASTLKQDINLWLKSHALWKEQTDV